MERRCPGSLSWFRMALGMGMDRVPEKSKYSPHHYLSISKLSGILIAAVGANFLAQGVASRVGMVLAPRPGVGTIRRHHTLMCAPPANVHRS